MGEARRVVAAWTDAAGRERRCMDDGSGWVRDEGEWHRTCPPLPPEALGEATDEPPAPDLGEWPGKPDVPPEHCRDIEILTPHGALLGDYLLGDWRLLCCQQDYAVIDPRDVLAWRELPLAFVDEDGRVTGVTHD